MADKMRAFTAAVTIIVALVGVALVGWLCEWTIWEGVVVFWLVLIHARLVEIRDSD